MHGYIPTLVCFGGGARERASDWRLVRVSLYLTGPSLTGIVRTAVRLFFNVGAHGKLCGVHTIVSSFQIHEQRALRTLNEELFTLLKVRTHTVRALFVPPAYIVIVSITVTHTHALFVHACPRQKLFCLISFPFFLPAPPTHPAT